MPRARQRSLSTDVNYYSKYCKYKCIIINNKLTINVMGDSLMYELTSHYCKTVVKQKTRDVHYIHKAPIQPNAK